MMSRRQKQHLNKSVANNEGQYLSPNYGTVLWDSLLKHKSWER